MKNPTHNDRRRTLVEGRAFLKAGCSNRKNDVTNETIKLDAETDLVD